MFLDPISISIIIISIFKRVHYGATSLKVEGSVPDGVIGIFQGLISSSLTVALGSTRPLTKMSNRNIFLGVKAAGE